MKNFTLLILIVAFAGFVQAANLPLDFETGTYVFTNFDGGVVTVINNPQSSGINTSAKVAQMVKNADKTWGGSWIALGSPIDFSINKKFKMKVFSPRIGAKVLLKVENMDNAAIAFDKEMLTTVANSWEELVFDYSLIDATKSYQKIIIIFDNGVMGDGSANFTFLFDDIVLFNDGNVTVAPSLPINFESETIDYAFVDFDGGAATVITNPKSSDKNASATVAQIVRNGGATWAGSKLIIDKNIDFSTAASFSMKVYSSRANVPVLFKLEGAGGAATEVKVNTTVANEWETMIWNFTGQPSGKFNTLVFMFDFGTVGNGSVNSTFLFDDIELIDQSGGLLQIDLPVTFEDETVNYAMSDFGGNVTVLGADPADATNTVATTTKTAGSETWAGTTIGTALGFAGVIPFSATHTKISMRVYSPAVGIIVRLKVEDHTNAALTAETEATTTVANTWETLIFDFSIVATGTNPWNPATNFDKMSVFFGFGNAGTGAVYHFDNVELLIPTRVENLKTELINIYSGNGNIFVKSDGALINGNIDIYDISGRKIHSKTIMSSHEKVAIHSSGIFIVRISDVNKLHVLSRKVVIN